MSDKKILKYPAVDFHMHFAPQTYLDALHEAGRYNVDRWPQPKWTLENNLEYIEKMNIGVGMLSISSPHIHFGDDQKARKLCRELNEQGADLVRQYPDKFGLMAILPLPDVDGSLAELEYALDVLKADGIKFVSNHEGMYMGDPRMEEIFQEISKRNKVAILHPTLPAKVPDTCEEVPIPAMEFMFDTMRAVSNLMFKGVFRRNPGMKFVVPHAGCVMSMLVDRYEGMAEKSGNVENPPHVFEEISHLYFDMAGYNWPRVLPALRSYVNPDHMVYGSDYPYMVNAETERLGSILMDSGFFTDDEMKKMLYLNAQKLFPDSKAVQSIGVK